MLLPDWLRWLWVAVFVGVVVVHCSHAVAVRGKRGAWHAGHVAMGLGMAAMVAPGWVETGPPALWGAVFVGWAAVVLAWLLRAWAARRAVGLRWLGSLLDMTGMAYMVGASTVAIPALTGAFVVYFGLVALAWLTGVFEDGTREPLPVALDPRPRTETSRASLTGVVSVGQRLSLAAMAVGMAYLFLAMEVGA